MRRLNDFEGDLVADLGVYGVWLLKHGKNLPVDKPVVQQLMNVYQLYHHHADNPTAGVLMGAIDAVIRELQIEDVGSYYPDAMTDLCGFTPRGGW